MNWNKTFKYFAYGCFMLSALMVLFVGISSVYAFPGNENITAATVNDNRVDPSDYVVWTMPILNNVTTWVNLTITYNSTVTGPYNVTLSGAGNAVINHTAPATYGNYTVMVTTQGAIQNITYTGFIVDLYNIDVDALYTELQEGFQTLLYANGSSVLDGHELTDGDTLIINGVTLSWNVYMDRFEATTTSGVPAIITFDTLTSLIETTYGITNGNITSSPTVTWTTSKLDLLMPFMRRGDWPGAIIQINVLLLGQSMFWTFFLMAISVGIYNYSGPEVVILIWMLGWSMFGVVIGSQALTIALIMMALAGGIYIAKFFLDRRTSV